MNRALRIVQLNVLLLLMQLTLHAQVYPVQVVPQLLPPYTLNLSEYYQGTQEKLVVLLTNTDLTKPNLQVRLKMSIQGQSAKLKSRDGVYYPPITLDAGTPQRLSLTDLAPYFNIDNLDVEGITRSQLQQSQKLPEGFYQFCFEAYEYNTNRLVGRSNCAMAWISLLDPPLLNLPRKGESILYKDPANIIFQWTPRNMGSPTAAFNTEYEFTLVELWDNGIAPEAAFGTMQPLYRTTTQATTLLYGPAEPLLIPGKRYGWRIRAQASDGSQNTDAYRNNGYSEIYWFTYQRDCPAPYNVQSEVSGGRVTITWNSSIQQTRFSVDYREKGQTDNQWYTVNSSSNRVMLYDLKKDKQYEYRVGAYCDAVNDGSFPVNGAVYSDIKSFTIDGSSADADGGGCNILQPALQIANRNAIQTLMSGDVITAGDFPVKLITVQGQGSFTGTGYITIPFIGKVAVKVRFSGITVNTDKQLIGGIIETTYDAKGSQIEDLDKLTDGGGGAGIVVRGVDTAGYYVDMVIPDARNIDVKLTTTVDSSGTAVPTGGATLTITGSDGTMKEVTVDELPATVKDKNGTIYNVDKDGHVTKLASSEPVNMTAAQLNTLQTDKAVVTFVPHKNQQYAFDEYQPVYSHSNLFKAEYEKLNDNYYVNSKAIVEAKSDVIKAVVVIKDNSIIADSIRFVTGKGTRYESTSMGDNTYEIKIVGGPAADAQELYALYPKGGGKYLSLGKLLIASYPERTFKMVLVPVNGASISKDAISQELNDIYKPVGISFQVTQDEKPFNDKSWDLNHDDKLAVSGSGWLSTLTDEMKALNSAYTSARTIQQDAIYLFVLNSSDSTLAGDMPRGKQFGYLFTGTDGRVAAHEVGHGLFKLKHAFDNDYGFKQGDLPSNVMDYPAGNRFTKYQWNQLYKPGIVIGLFEKDNDGQLTITSTDAFKNLKNVTTNTYTFLSPGGLPVTIPATATNITLSETNYFTSKEDDKYLHTTPFGTLVSFTLKNGDKTELYTAAGTTSTRTFVQYECIKCDGDKNKVYIDNLTAKETSGNVILAWPCFSNPSGSDDLNFTIKAKWFQPGDDSWKIAKESQNYGAGGKFADAEKLLEKAAAEFDPYDGKIAYTVSTTAGNFSDFQNSKRASTFISDNCSCERMPLPVIMNIANLIKLNEADYEAYVQCKNQGKEPSDYAEPYDEVLETKEAAEQYLADFQNYLKTSKQDLRLDTITDSDLMETTLGNMCWAKYSSLTSAQRIQILKVLTQRNNWINGCLFSNKMKCEESQLITVIKTIPDKKQAQEVANFLNTNQRILLRLIRDVDDGTNHDEMMKALFDLCQLKDDHNTLTADDLVGNRLHYRGSFDYGAFTITATINRVDFGENGGTSFFIEEQRAQVFASDAPVSVRQKYQITLPNNGFAWYNTLKPLDPVIIEFGEDFKLTRGEVVFKKGDIVRIPALYLWHLYDIDSKMTAQLLRENAVKFAVNGATLISIGTAQGATAQFFATLDFASTAFVTIVSPTLLRQNLSPEAKEIVEAFDELGQLYMLYRTGEATLGLGKLFKDYVKSYAEKVREARSAAQAGSDEKAVLDKIEDVVESADAESVGPEVADGVQTTGADALINVPAPEWLPWAHYEKHLINGEEFALIKGKYYSQEAVEVAGANQFHLKVDEVNETIEKGSSFTKVQGSVTQTIFYNGDKNIWVVTESHGSNTIVRALAKADFASIDIAGTTMPHIKERDISDPNRRDVVGCHDETKFATIKQSRASLGNQNYQIPAGVDLADVDEIYIIKDEPHPTVPHVRIIEYRVPKLNGARKTTGELKGPSTGTNYVKTIYDPTHWTDPLLETAIKEAFQDASIRQKGVFNHPKGQYEGFTKEGYKIIFYFRSNRITTFYFVP